MKNPISTRLSPTELKDLEEACKKNKVKPAEYLRDMYRQGVEKDTLKLMLFHELKSQKIELLSAHEKQLKEVEERLEASFNARLNEAKASIVMALSQRMSMLATELNNTNK